MEQNRKQDWKEALCESDRCQNEGKRNYCGDDFSDKWNRICLVSHTTVIHWNCQSSTLILVVLLGGLTLAGSCSKRGQNCTNVRQVCLLGSLAHGSLNNSFKIIKKTLLSSTELLTACRLLAHCQSLFTAFMLISTEWSDCGLCYTHHFSPAQESFQEFTSLQAVHKLNGKTMFTNRIKG